MKLRSLVAGIGALAMLVSLGTARAAVDKVVYRDANYKLSWANADMSDQLATYLAGKGYTQVDAAGLRAFCLKHIADHAPSVIVMANDVAPDTVMDPVGANNDPNPASTYLSYLNNGGKVVYLFDWPCYYIGLADGTNLAWNDTGANRAFGFWACRWNGGVTTDDNKPVVFTDEGKKWGLTKVWQSKRAALVTDIDVVLGHPQGVDAAAMPWEKLFTWGRPGSGFIYMYDLPAGDAANGGNPVQTEPWDDRDMAQIDAVASYFPDTSATLYGIKGTIKDAAGKTVAGARVNVTAEGKTGTRSLAAADDGTFSLGVPNGTYYLSPVGAGLDIVPGGTKVVVNGADVTVTVDAIVLPSVMLGTADGVTWKLLDYADAGDATALAKDAKDFAPADPAFNDSSWAATKVPGDLTNAATTDPVLGTNTYFWYRSSKFKISDALKAVKTRFLVLDNYNIDDQDWTYLNGHLLGTRQDGWNNERVYAVDPAWVNWDGDNVVAIKGYQGGGGAGISSANGTGAPRLRAGSAYTGAISGKVTLKDLPNVPAGFQVLMTAADGTKTTLNPTGDGTYRINDVVPGTYTLTLTGGAVGSSTPASLSETVVASKYMHDQNFTMLYKAFPVLPAVVDKAVYYDDTLGVGWFPLAEGARVRDWFVGKGYKALDAAALKTFMSAHVTSKVPSAIVLAQDILPDNVVDITTGSVTKAGLVNQYMDNGGRLVHYGDIPFYNIAKMDGTGNFTAGDAGSTTILGFSAGGGTRDVNDTVVNSLYGNALGMKSSWPSVRPAPTTAVDVVLESASGGAAGWIKFFPTSAGPGYFARLVDVGVTADTLGDNALADGQRLAELNGKYNGPGLAEAGGTVTPPVAFGDLNGDGKVSITDVVTALRGVAGLVTLTDAQKLAADVNGDGKFNISDVVMMLRFVAGLITKFPAA
ncbi:MAG TPA: dockerin type I domain-containing protein, partial [Armatimonadota bacterium]